MNKNIDKIFTKTLCVIVMALFVVCPDSNAAVRTAVRGNSASRRPVATTTKTVTTTQQKTTETVPETEPVEEPEPEPIYNPKPAVELEPENIEIANKTGQFNDALSGANVSTGDSSVSDLAEQIRKQRAAFEAKEASEITLRQQQEALAYGKNTCDNGLRKCMSETCGSNFSKCALDGDTMFGEKLNKCRMKTTCTGEEFRLFTTEIKADRDFNVQMASYDAVVECGNKYNQCITTECGTTFGKCLGKNAADRAIKKCATIAKNCTEQDSGLASRMGTVIGRLRETAEKDVKTDEERLHKLRDLMRKQCQHLGAMFDERSFDCVYTVNFFAGENQSSPLASRKAYAGDSFVCMQEWFGINATTFKENAYRETRSQTGASSAMLGAGLGTAAGLITSGAIDRALTTQQAKKDYKKECKSQGGKLKDGECVKKGDKDYEKIKPEDEDKDNTKAEARAECKENGGKYFLGKCWGANGSDDATEEIPSEETEDATDPSRKQRRKKCKEKQKTDSNCKWRIFKGECDCTPKSSEDESGKPDESETPQLNFNYKGITQDKKPKSLETRAKESIGGNIKLDKIDTKTGDFSLDSKIFQNNMSQTLGTKTDTPTTETKSTTTTTPTLKPMDTKLTTGKKSRSPLQQFK